MISIKWVGVAGRRRVGGGGWWVVGGGWWVVYVCAVLFGMHVGSYAVDHFNF